MYYSHNIKKKGISDNYLSNYHTSLYCTESVSNKECLFCTRKKLNSMVDKLINNPDYIKK